LSGADEGASVTQNEKDAWSKLSKETIFTLQKTAQEKQEELEKMAKAKQVELNEQIKNKEKTVAEM